MDEAGRMIWVGNGWRLARGIREIRRGLNKGKVEAKYLKGSKIKKIIIRSSAIKDFQNGGK